MLRPACAWAGRPFVVLVALLLFATAFRPAFAQDLPDCGHTPQVRIDSATLVLHVDAAGPAVTYELSGRGTLTDVSRGSAPLHPYNMCADVVSHAFEIDNRPFCMGAVSRGFHIGDELTRNGDAVSFAFSDTVEQTGRGSYFSIDVPSTICAARLDLEIRPAADTDIELLALAPERLDATSARFRFSRQADRFGQTIGVSLTRRSADAGPSGTGGTGRAEPRDERRPPSLTEQVGYRKWMIKETVASFLSVASAFLIVFLFSRRHRLPYTATPFWEVAARPLVMSAGLVLCPTFITWNAELTPLIGRILDSFRSEIWSTFRVTDYYRYINNDTSKIIFYILAFPILIVLDVLSRTLSKNRLGLWAFLAVLARAALLGLLFAVLGSLVALLSWIADHFGKVGYEIPATAVSVLFGVIAVSAVKRLFRLRSAQTWLLAFVLGGSVFLPMNSVITGIGGDVSAADNAEIWIRVVSSQYATLVYVAGLAGLAFWLARQSRRGSGQLSRWLLVLLLMQIAQFAMTSVASAFAAVSFILSAHFWIFRPEDRNSVASTTAAPTESRADADFCWYVGGVSATIFLVQYLFGEARTGFDALPLLELAQILPTFAIGATGGLLLSRAMPRLRGRNATIKAFNLGLVLIGTNIAVHLDRLGGISKVGGVLSEHIAVVSALIFCTVYRYDLPRIRSADGQIHVRGLFTGTAIADAIPLISAVAAAIASAAIPILSNEVGSALADVLRSTLPSAVATAGRP